MHRYSHVCTCNLCLIQYKRIWLAKNLKVDVATMYERQIFKVFAPVVMNIDVYHTSYKFQVHLAQILIYLSIYLFSFASYKNATTKQTRYNTKKLGHHSNLVTYTRLCLSP